MSQQKLPASKQMEKVVGRLQVAWGRQASQQRLRERQEWNHNVV